MEAILLLLGLIWVLWWINTQLLPTPTRVLQRLAGSIIRRLVSVAWSSPVRRSGIGRTVWLWSLALAVLVSVQALILPLTVMSLPQRLLTVIQAWLLVAAIWWLLSWWSQRQFRARPLPQRRLRRR